MKTTRLASTVLLIGLSIFAGSWAEAQPTDDSWSSYNQMLVNGMLPESDVNKPNILKQIIFNAETHEDSLQVKAAIPSIMDYYKQKTTAAAHRIMALTALYHLKNSPTMRWVELQIGEEPSLRVRRHMCRILESYYANRGNNPRKADYYGDRAEALFEKYMQAEEPPS